jgi:hypothetical protein
MSLLPQRKKSAEEIAKLRETLGITAPSQGESDLPVETPPESLPEKQGGAISDRPVHEGTLNSASLRTLTSHGHGGSESAAPWVTGDPSSPTKKIEPLLSAAAHLPFAEIDDAISTSPQEVPVLPREVSGPPATAVEHLPPPEEHPAPLPVEQPATRIVRSLRKSEQGPVHAPPPPAPDSKLPIYRHSDKELNEIRRREALAIIGHPILPQTHTAHLALVIPGYLFAIIGGVAVAIPEYLAEIATSFGLYADNFEKILTAACAGLALLIAAFIYFRKPFSRHHAAFIGVITLFVIIFGALQFFPQLRHGT